MDREWAVEIGGKNHLVQVEYGALITDSESAGETILQKDGQLLVDGKQVRTWKEGLPKEIRFEIENKPAVLNKKGLFSARLDLSVDGKPVKPNKS